MAAWLIDKVLPGVAVGTIMSAGTWLSHHRLRRHIEQVTARQTATLAGGERRDDTPGRPQ